MIFIVECVVVVVMVDNGLEIVGNMVDVVVFDSSRHDS